MFSPRILVAAACSLLLAVPVIAVTASAPQVYLSISETATASTAKESIELAQWIAANHCRSLGGESMQPSSTEMYGAIEINQKKLYLTRAETTCALPKAP